MCYGGDMGLQVLGTWILVARTVPQPVTHCWAYPHCACGILLFQVVVFVTVVGSLGCAALVESPPREHIFHQLSRAHALWMRASAPRARPLGSGCPCQGLWVFLSVGVLAQIVCSRWVGVLWCSHILGHQDRTGAHVLTHQRLCGSVANATSATWRPVHPHLHSTVPVRHGQACQLLGCSQGVSLPLCCLCRSPHSPLPASAPDVSPRKPRSLRTGCRTVHYGLGCVGAHTGVSACMCRLGRSQHSGSYQYGQLLPYARLHDPASDTFWRRFLSGTSSRGSNRLRCICG